MDNQNYSKFKKKDQNKKDQNKKDTQKNKSSKEKENKRYDLTKKRRFERDKKYKNYIYSGLTLFIALMLMINK